MKICCFTDACNRKQLQDEDEREVMRFKEMYLQDGDLYSEGGGRMRNFRWKDVGMYT